MISSCDPKQKLIKQSAGERIALRQRLTNASFLVLAAASWFTATGVSIADDRGQVIDPKDIHDLLDTVGRLMRSSYGTCPHLSLRVRPDPVADTSEVGYVLLVFDVSRQGKAINIEVVESSVGAEQQEEAIAIAKLFNFGPYIQDNKLRVFENWVERIDFLVEGGAPDDSWPGTKGYMETRCPQ